MKWTGKSPRYRRRGKLSDSVLFLRLLNQSITSWEFFPWLRLQHDRTFSFIFSTICLLTSPRLPKQQAFITVKDHKDSFPNKVPCRLINPVKSNLGLVSKQIVEKINEKVRSCCNLNQGKNSHDVIDWLYIYPYHKPNNPPSTSTRCPTIPHQSLNSYPMPSTADCPACLAIDLNLKKQRPSTKTL